MADPKPLDRAALAAKLIENVVVSPKMMSVRWLAICTFFGGIWALVPKESQDAILHSLPVQPVWLPLIAAVIAYLTRVWPQSGLPQPTPGPATQSVAVPSRVGFEITDVPEAPAPRALVASPPAPAPPAGAPADLPSTLTAEQRAELDELIGATTEKTIAAYLAVKRQARATFRATDPGRAP